jgi:hypothetical protein
LRSETFIFDGGPPQGSDVEAKSTRLYSFMEVVRLCVIEQAIPLMKAREAGALAASEPCARRVSEILSTTQVPRLQNEKPMEVPPLNVPPPLSEQKFLRYGPEPPGFDRLSIQLADAGALVERTAVIVPIDAITIDAINRCRLLPLRYGDDI